MKVKAKDSFHLSGVGLFRAGQELEVTDTQAKELEKAGLVKIVGESKAKNESAEKKAATVPENKKMPETNRDAKKE